MIDPEIIQYLNLSEETIIRNLNVVNKVRLIKQDLPLTSDILPEDIVGLSKDRCCLKVVIPEEDGHTVNFFVEDIVELKTKLPRVIESFRERANEELVSLGRCLDCIEYLENLKKDWQ